MNPIILVVPIITTIIFVGAWLYEYIERKDDQKEAKYWKGMYGAVRKKEESANEIIMEQDKSNHRLNRLLFCSQEQLTTANKAFEAFKLQAESETLARSGSTDIFRLKAELNQLHKAHELLVKELEDAKKMQAGCDKYAYKLQLDLQDAYIQLSSSKGQVATLEKLYETYEDKYKDLIAMPRRKRDALVKELRAEK